MTYGIVLLPRPVNFVFGALSGPTSFEAITLVFFGTHSKPKSIEFQPQLFFFYSRRSTRLSPWMNLHPFKSTCVSESSRSFLPSSLGDGIHNPKSHQSIAILRILGSLASSSDNPRYHSIEIRKNHQRHVLQVPVKFDLIQDP